MTSTLLLTLRRLRAPIILLITIFAVGMTGLVLIPGEDAAADEIELHVDDDQRGVRGRRGAVEGPGIGVGVDGREGLHGVHRFNESSPGAPSLGPGLPRPISSANVST